MVFDTGRLTRNYHTFDVRKAEILYKGQGVGCILWNKLRNGRQRRSDRQEIWKE